MIGFSSKEDSGPALLDGREVSQVNADLTAGVDVTKASPLKANDRLCFMGITKVGRFDIDSAAALRFLRSPNPNVKPNSDVIRPLRNGSDLVRVCSDRWIIDFDPHTPMSEAALYGLPFEHLTTHVKQERQKNGRASYRERWWIHGESRPGFRTAVAGLRRYIATARVATHRVFVWLDTVILPDSKVIAIALDDDANFGIIHSRIHEAWTIASCGMHGVGKDPTYNPTTCFETFPFPRPTDGQRAVIAEAGQELDRLRNNWLYPPDWTREEVLEFRGFVSGPWARYVHDPDSSGVGTVRFPRLVPKDAASAQALAARTLTNLYNENPTWLKDAHAELDAAVFAAYDWKPGMSDEEILAGLLELNLSGAAGQPTPASETPQVPERAVTAKPSERAE
jgi:hypothetical protein